MSSTGTSITTSLRAELAGLVARLVPEIRREEQLARDLRAAGHEAAAKMLDDHATLGLAVVQRAMQIRRGV